MRRLVTLFWVLSLSCVSAAQAQDEGFIRTLDGEAGAISLQVAARAYASQQTGAVVWLVGAVHIGEPGFYASVSRQMEDVDLVLYEGVGRPNYFGELDADPLRKSQLALQAAEQALMAYASAQGRPPTRYDELIRFARDENTVLANVLYHTRNDAWGSPLDFRFEPGAVTITSLGADRRPGGEGDAADLVLVVEDFPEEPVPDDDITRLQQALADGFGLAYQLTAINYERPHYVPSDMGVDELMPGFGDLEGDEEDRSEMLQALTGIDPAMVAIVEQLAQMMQGSPQMRTLGRLVLIEVLGTQDVMRLMELAGGEEMVDLLIHQRNQRVIEDLDYYLRQEDAPESVAIFYGAGHLEDLAERLGALGFHETQEVVWHDAIRADLDAMGMSRDQANQIRGVLQQTIERAMEQQMQQQETTEEPQGDE